MGLIGWTRIMVGVLYELERESDNEFGHLICCVRGICRWIFVL